VTAYIGLQTIHQLWTLFGTPTVPLSKFAQHFIARAICLIAIPVALYIGFFVIHFWALPLTGPGSNFMSEEFREGLQQVNASLVHNCPRRRYWFQTPQFLISGALLDTKSVHFGCYQCVSLSPGVYCCAHSYQIITGPSLNSLGEKNQFDE
jgi:hypothetical protein